eukprot:5559077-Prorocentrum_lima.AAC.1
MTSSLVGSEMCIRDSSRGCRCGRWLVATYAGKRCGARSADAEWLCTFQTCLLYTSDAADDM